MLDLGFRIGSLKPMNKPIDRVIERYMKNTEEIQMRETMLRLDNGQGEDGGCGQSISNSKSGALLDAFVAKEDGKFVLSTQELLGEVKTVDFADMTRLRINLERNDARFTFFSSWNTFSWCFSIISTKKAVGDALLDEIITTFPDRKSHTARDGFPAVPDYKTLVCMEFLKAALLSLVPVFLSYYPIPTALLLTLCVAWLIRKAQQQAGLSHFPLVVKPHPLYGHVPFLFPNGIHDLSSQLPQFLVMAKLLWTMESDGTFAGRKIGGYCLKFIDIPFPKNPFVVVTDLDTVLDLLSARTQDSQTKGRAYNVAKPLIGNGVLSSSGSVWKTHRRMLDLGFRIENLRQASNEMNKPINRLIDRWLKNPDQFQQSPFDMREEMLRLTIDVICQVGFGRDFEGADDDLMKHFEPVRSKTDGSARKLFFKVFTEIGVLIFGNVFYPSWWYDIAPTETNQAIRQKIKLIDDVVKTIIREKMEDVDQSTSSAKSGVLLDAFVAKEDGKFVLSAEELLDEIKTLIFAGHDTTGNTLSWCFYIISTNHFVHDALLDEINTTFPDWKSQIAQDGFPAVPDYEKLIRMPFLNGFLNEILRFYPPAGFTRRTIKDVIWGGNRIPKGTGVFVLPSIIHLNPKYFKEPNAFIPERWIEADYNGPLPADVKLKKLYMDRRAYMPFSQGPRNCVGMKLAQAELRMTVVRLLQRFQFETTEPEHPKTNFNLTLNPDHVMIKVTPRKV
ncbi:cytochrome P450 [Cladochytrium replicatum]|nr:cytochrome P450 [Cladochytrium replicatum]